jgi:transposase
MATKAGDRYQRNLFPPSIEEYVGIDDPVRAYDAIIDALPIDEIGLHDRKSPIGNSNYDPKAMLKILVYAYSYGWQSSRKIERALHHNLSFIWIAGGLKPDYRTISRFRKNNSETLKRALKQCARVCIKLDLIEGNILFLDGSKFRGNSSINKTYTQKGYRKLLDKVEKKINTLLAEIDAIDDQEQKIGSAKLKEELQNQESLRDKVKSVLEEMKAQGVDKINNTDNDAVNFKGRQGSHAGYNVQVVTDEKNGLIVHADVVAESNDKNQFSSQIDQANKNLKDQCKAACGDSGYHNVNNLSESVEKGMTVIVPSQKQASDNPTEDCFSKENFTYDEDNDAYICPEGHIVRFSHYSKKKDHDVYRMEVPSICRECPHWGVCTKGKRGRTINRLKNEACQKKLASIYESDYGQNIYKKRKMKVELQFGHIKRNLRGGSFLVRSLKSVQGEMAIYASCFNIARMITLLGGVKRMVRLLSEGAVT